MSRYILNNLFRDNQLELGIRSCLKLWLFSNTPRLDHCKMYMWPAIVPAKERITFPDLVNFSMIYSKTNYQNMDERFPFV
jgi:hypothetical protein